MPLPMFQDNEKNQKTPTIKNIIAIAAGKGGVGKSTVAVNLALALKKNGYKVGLMDTDIYGPSVRKMLPEDRLPTQNGKQIIPALCQGVRMISLAYFRNENEAAAVRAPIANGIVTQFIHQVQWGDLDYLFIDFPPGTGDVQLTMAQQANLTGAVMVSTPQEVAVMDVRKAMHLFDQVKVPIVGVLENMSGYYPEGCQEPIYLFGKGGAERLALEAGVPFLGRIPLDPEVSACGDRGESIFSKEGSRAAQVFLDVAGKMVDHVEAMNRKEDSLRSFELIWQEV